MAFSGFQDFNPKFRAGLEPFLAARPGITINSGYRTPQRQAELFAQALAKYGSVQEARIHVAPAPGTYGSEGSRHNFGLAADLAYATDADRQWAHDHAAEYGLNFRMGHEPWHIELIGGKPTVIPNQALVAQAGDVTSGGSYGVPPPPPSSPDEPPVIPLKRVQPFTTADNVDPNGPNERNNYSMNLLNDAIAKREDRVMKLRKQLLEGIKSYS